MSAILNPVEYGRLCGAALPKIIESDEEHDRLLAVFEKIAAKGTKTPEEAALAELLARLCQEYEDRVYPVPDVPAHELIAYLMEKRGLRQADLVPAVFPSRSEASDVIGGRREPSKAHIRKLADFFKVSTDLFL